MFYLFILESIGTSELLLIGLVALIIFGPRKLPELAKMLGKARNEFKRTTDDFKETWMREVDFESDEKQTGDEISMKNSVERDALKEKSIAAPEVKAISQSEFQEAQSLPKTISAPEKIEDGKNDKRDWL